MEGYVIIKRVVHAGDFSVVYVALGRSEDEEPDANNKEQRSLTLAWRADHKRIRKYLETSHGVDLLIGDLILEYRLVYAEVIKNIKKTATKAQAKEMLAYIDGFITASIEQNL